MTTPVPMALALLLATMSPTERVLVVGSLADALAFAAGSSSPVVDGEVDSDAVATVRPGGVS